jgi:hypothetical protein
MQNPRDIPEALIRLGWEVQKASTYEERATLASMLRVLADELSSPSLAPDKIKRTGYMESKTGTAVFQLAIGKTVVRVEQHVAEVPSEAEETVVTFSDGSQIRIGFEYTAHDEHHTVFDFQSPPGVSTTIPAKEERSAS